MDAMYKETSRFTSHTLIGNDLYLLPNKMIDVKDIQRTSFRAFRVSTRLPDISAMQASVVHPSSSGPVAVSEFRKIADDYQRIIPIRRGLAVPSLPNNRTINMDLYEGLITP